MNSVHRIRAKNVENVNNLHIDCDHKLLMYRYFGSKKAPESRLQTVN